MRTLTTSVALLIAVLAPSSCGPQEAAPTGRSGVRIVFATHGQSADPFWSIVANGARAAAQDLDVRVEYQAPPRFDMVAMSNLIEAAVASNPSGIVVSIPDGAALASSIRSAVNAGIPVISINAGDDVYRDLGVLLHIGQPELDAGRAAGDRLAVEGARTGLCVNHEVGNVSLDQRCDGFRAGLAGAGGTVEVVSVDLGNPDDAQQRIANALAAGPQIDALLTLGPAGAVPALAALRQSDRVGSLAVATFDLSPEVIDALIDGTMDFAIDQQPFLQGYLPVVSLVNYIETLTLPGGGGVLKTGPGFVTQDNAARVRTLTSQGIR